MAAATAWGGFVSRKPASETKSEVLDQIADRWIEEHENSRKTGKRWADFESDIESDDDSWFN